ncbi:hypothetical protein [Flagellimonas oceanensis]|uniref:hypothetical protein n=1 Tax=Flagellimonas oceanensis TaxID=2499163 RepID=UPI000F8E075C|nr:hypothetical protein [Allomuricauda oceanensis]
MPLLKVFWLDDEHDKLNPFKVLAKAKGIELVGYKSTDGLTELEANYNLYDAVLFDAKFFKNETDVAGSESLSNLPVAIDRLSKIPKIFKPFVLTGQAKFFNDEVFDAFVPEYYKKGVAEDNERLFRDLKDFALGQVETQIRHEYEEAFEAINLGILPSRSATLLMDIIKCHKANDFRKKNINNQRGLLELIFKSLNDPIPCIPDEFFNPLQDNRPNLEWCCIYMENRNVRDPISRNTFTCPVTIDQEIKPVFRKIMVSVNKYSHDNENEIAKVPFNSNMHALLELLGWLPAFVQTNYPNYI